MKSIVINKNKNFINISTTKSDTKNIKENNKLLINYISYLQDKTILVNTINKMLNKNKIYTLTISNKSLLNDIISIIHELKYITIIDINTKTILDNKVIYKLVNCKNIKVIKCYDINTNMYNLIDNNDILFITTNNIYTTHFYEINNMFTNSSLYYKNKIIIDNKCNINDIQYLFNLNKYLKFINIMYIEVALIKEIINILLKYNIHDVIVNICVNEDNINILNKNILELKKLKNSINKKQNIKLKINYSNKYKQKFYLKQLNNIYVKTTMIVIFFIVITYFLIIGYYEYKTNKVIDDVQNITDILNKLDNNNDIVINDTEDDTPPEISDENINVSENNTNSSSSNVLVEDFNKLLSINSEFVGWLKIKNTKVSYPVVKHNDNDYYLNHNFYNNINNAGWVFMDYRNEIDNMDQNTIIYGHSNTINDTMFGSLDKVLNESWYTKKENQIISFNSLYENMNFQIFAIYITNPEYYYIWTNFYNNNERFNTFISEVKQKSIYDFGVDVSIDDTILTLSTCYNRGKDRIAIHAKKI